MTAPYPLTAADERPEPREGYWLLGQDGAVFTFGSKLFHGSLTGLATPRRDDVIGLARARHGGYWIACSNGDVFAFDATAHPTLASMGIQTTSIVGIAGACART